MQRTEKRGFGISYADFWRLYLDAHRRPATRAVHYTATAVGAGGTVAAILLREPLLCAGSISAAYAMAVSAHRFIEHNRPLIRVNPLYGAAADLRMMWLATIGRLGAEYRRLGLDTELPATALGAVAPRATPPQ